MRHTLNYFSAYETHFDQVLIIIGQEQVYSMILIGILCCLIIVSISILLQTVFPVLDFKAKTVSGRSKMRRFIFTE